MLPTVNPNLFKIDGGNVQIPQKLLEHARADMHQANVTKVIKLADGTYQIHALYQSTSRVSCSSESEQKAAKPNTRDPLLCLLHVGQGPSCCGDPIKQRGPSSMLCCPDMVGSAQACYAVPMCSVLLSPGSKVQPVDVKVATD